MKNLLLRFWRWTMVRELNKCARYLMRLGFDNGNAQNHIDAAKDEIYRAIREIEKEQP